MPREFPRQDIPLIEKTEEWFKKHLFYARDLLISYNGTRQRMTRLYESYNGVKIPGSLKWLENNYGKQNKSKYIAYRSGRTKLNLLHGEWLKRPLTATVETTNSEARSAKMQQLDFMTGAMIAKDELLALKDKVGVDVMQGAPIPESPDDPIWQKMSPKDKDEDIMQIILDEGIKELGLHKKIADNFLDLLITSMCYCKIEINEDGEVCYYRIDPRDAIYEQIENDDYLEKSPVMGARIVMSAHEVLRRYNLTKEQRDQLQACILNPSNYEGNSWIRVSNGELLVDVIHIEWKSWDAEYYKLSPKTKSQMELDPTSDVYEIDITDTYEKNKDIHDANVAKGLYKIETKWKECTYEGTMIGNIIFTDMRRKYFQKRSEDKPAYVLSSSYHGFILGTLDGTRVSLQQMLENLDNLFDIVMYQILKELARAKGKVLTYDRAALPQGRKLADVMYQALNDQFLDFDSSAAGNVSQRTIDPSGMFKEFDLGVSESFEYLLAMKNDILNTMNILTGINENREGQIAASSTASNANSAISASRTITEPIFAGMDGFVKRVMMSVIDSYKTSYCYYKTEKGDYILGSDKLNYLKVEKSIGYKDYDAHIENGSEYMQLRQEMNALMEFSLNAKEIRPMDVLKVKLAKTTAAMKNTLESSWIAIQKASIESQQRDIQAQQQQQQENLAHQQQMIQQEVDNKMLVERNKILEQKVAQMEIDDNKSKNKVIEQSHSATSDAINSQV